MRLIFILLFSIGSLYSQFDSRNLVFINNYMNWSSGVFRFIISSDTCLNSKRYRKIDFNYLPQPCGNNILNTWYLRNDSQKIYLYYPKVNVEKIIYNFNVKKGDTVKIFPPKSEGPGYFFIDTVPGPEQQKIVQLDTTILYENTYRKTIYFENDTIVWIEGIGALNAMWLDPFGKRRFVVPFWDRYEMAGIVVNDSLTLFNPNPQLWKTNFANYFSECKEYYPFYLYKHCDNPIIVDTIQLDHSPCSKPSTYQNFAIKQNTISAKCRDTVWLSLDKKYVPPSFTYKFVPDSFIVLRPPYDSMKTTLFTYVSDTTCNKKIKFFPSHQCIVCKDTMYQPLIESAKPRDTFNCPDSIVRNYKFISGNFDTSFSWKYITPLPKIYGNNDSFFVRVQVKNIFCTDTITTDTLILRCDTICKFKEIPCIQIFSNKQEVVVGDSVSFSHTCSSNCDGYSASWDNNKSIELIPLTYSDTFFIKKLFYQNKYMVQDSAEKKIKVLKKSGIETVTAYQNIIIHQWKLRLNSGIPFKTKVWNSLGALIMNISEINEVSLEQLPQGIYYFELESKEFEKVRWKFIKSE